jgi:phosphoenolpyruvate---glycerone phosphotransferase subunit DhaK
MLSRALAIPAPPSMKRLINLPDAVAAEAIEGFSLAYSRHVRQLEGLQAVVRRTAAATGEVAVVTGGGSGHEPMFLGYVGPGMAHGSVAGNVFTSPPPQPIYTTAKAAHAGAGVLFVYGNYAGDVLNFDAAAEMLSDEGIEVAAIRVADDVASALPEARSERRGIAGDLFVIKVAGARAAEGATLAQVTAAADKANDATRSMGVALSSCTIPAAGRPIFELEADEIGLGLGLHGEPGIETAKMMSADEIASYLLSRVLKDLGTAAGDEVSVLVNGLGNTPLSELFIVNRMANRLISDAGLRMVRSYVGNYATSLDMAGCSITVMRLDPELERLLLAPADSPAFMQM